MAKPYLSVIIPTRDNGETISLMLLDVDRYLREKKFSYEILVVDDGSEDRTAAAVNALVPTVKNLKIIQNAGTRGIGTAVKIGVLTSKGVWRLVTDPYESISVAEFAALIPRIAPRENTHMFIASRSHPESSVKGMPIMRRLIEGGMNIAFRLAHKSSVRDVLTPFLCVSEEIVDPIFSRMQSQDFGYLCEAVTRGTALGYRIEEIPVSMVIKSQKNPISYLQTGRETATIWWQLRRKSRVEEMPSNAV
ncbi:MAG: glycosyltransferase [Patescibacteria group bacterium]